MLGTIGLLFLFSLNLIVNIFFCMKKVMCKLRVGKKPDLKTKFVKHCSLNPFFISAAVTTVCFRFYFARDFVMAHCDVDGGGSTSISGNITVKAPGALFPVQLKRRQETSARQSVTNLSAGKLDNNSSRR